MNHETGGRPRVYTGQDTAMQSVTLRMPFWHMRVARRYGSGNVSEGVRIALERLAADDRAESIPMPVRVAPC